MHVALDELEAIATGYEQQKLLLLKLLLLDRERERERERERGRELTRAHAHLSRFGGTSVAAEDLTCSVC